jgi:hypothetical protein
MRFAKHMITTETQNHTEFHGVFLCASLWNLRVSVNRSYFRLGQEVSTESGSDRVVVLTPSLPLRVLTSLHAERFEAAQAAGPEERHL